MKNNLLQKIELSQKTQKEWRNWSFEKRQQLLPKLSQLVLSRVADYSKLITEEMHKPIAQAESEVTKCAQMIDYYAQAENILATKKVDTEFYFSEIRYEPMGVILGIMPWNFPFWQVLRFAVPTLLAGNAVVLKHASLCSKTGQALEQLFIDAGFPKGLYQNIVVSHTEIEELIAHPIIKGVSLTGSDVAGRKVAALAGQHIKKSLLELGGNDAFIVLDDAPLAPTAKQGAAARLRNCGQACTSAKRFIIQENIYQDFLKYLVEEFHKYKVGDATCATTELSGLAKKEFADTLQRQYDIALQNGAKVILALERFDDLSFSPGIIEVSPDNPIFDEELFGPLAMVIPVKDDAQALEIANQTRFGLGNSVWTLNEERARYFVTQLESGTVSVNKLMTSDPRFPFGGAKLSGYGLELSLETLKEFVITKSIFGNRN